MHPNIKQEMIRLTNECRNLRSALASVGGLIQAMLESLEPGVPEDPVIVARLRVMTRLGHSMVRGLDIRSTSLRELLAKALAPTINPDALQVPDHLPEEL